MKSIAIIMTAHNRKNQTLSCLDSLHSQSKLTEGVKKLFFLVDDGSTDGTSEAVHCNFPDVSIIPGTGDLFWNRGMHLAFGEALKEDHDYYLWINDDTTLFPNALSELLNTSAIFQDKAIIVGSTKDPVTGEWTYGGFRRLHPWRPLKFTRVLPGGEPVPIEAMNGNCVLIPRHAAGIVGNLDPIFSHGMGDFDYALRARKKGVEIYLAPGYYAYCIRDTEQYPDEPKKQKIIRKFSKKGLPPRDWAVFAKRYAGPIWPVYWASPYLRTIFFSAAERKFG